MCDFAEGSETFMHIFCQTITPISIAPRTRCLSYSRMRFRTNGRRPVVTSTVINRRSGGCVTPNMSSARDNDEDTFLDLQRRRQF